MDSLESTFRLCACVRPLEVPNCVDTSHKAVLVTKD